MCAPVARELLPPGLLAATALGYAGTSMGKQRATAVWLGAAAVVSIAHGRARAGTLVGHFDVPQLAPPPPATHGFLDRTENPFTPVRGDVTRQIVIVLEGDEKPGSPPQVTWDLVGESFARPVIAAPAGAEVVIRNTSKTARSLGAREDEKLLDPGPLNPTATKSFHVAAAGKVFTIADKDAPHLVGRVIVVNTPYVAYPDEAGHFQIDNVAAGNYKVKIWYRDRWLDRPDDSVDIPAKGKIDFNPKLAAGAFAPAPAK